MTIKRSTLAGTWYPAGRELLSHTVDSLLAQATAQSLGDLVGLVTPHAAYRYSGAIAASAYRQLQGARCDRVVILAPSHRRSYRGLVVLDAEAFETPLGRVEIDPVPSWRLDLARRDPVPFEGEHSLEIQLPFLQRCLPAARVVPLLFGRLEPADYAVVAAAMVELADEGTVFVVSSDFTHYGRAFGFEPFPADDAAAVGQGLRALDMEAIEPILKGDGVAFGEFIAATGDTVCGRVPIGAFLSWLPPGSHGKLVDYGTSLDVTGDYEHTVSYAAIAFPRHSGG